VIAKETGIDVALMSLMEVALGKYHYVGTYFKLQKSVFNFFKF
jgi:hypothetical protein